MKPLRHLNAIIFSRVNMKKSIWFSAVLFLINSAGLTSQVTVSISPSVKLTFPGQPEVIDTLGQKVFHYSDETGYYACIVQQTNLNATKRSTLDLSLFYNEVYQSLVIPEDHCKQVKQQDITIQDLAGMEYYATCDQNPETPELRYKRLILYEARLFVLDFWTTQAYFSQAGARKNAFFESMNLEDNAAPIPSAFQPTEPASGPSYKWLILILVLVPAIYWLTKRKPKK